MLSKRIIACLDVRDGRWSASLAIRSAGTLPNRRAAGAEDRRTGPRHHGIARAPPVPATPPCGRARAVRLPWGGYEPRLMALRRSTPAPTRWPEQRRSVQPGLLTLANRYGSQAVVCAIDAKHAVERQEHLCRLPRSGSTAANRDAVEWAGKRKNAPARSASDRSGRPNRFDCEIPAVSKAVSSRHRVFARDFTTSWMFSAGCDAAPAAYYVETSVHALKEHLADTTFRAPLTLERRSSRPSHADSSD